MKSHCMQITRIFGSISMVLFLNLIPDFSISSEYYKYINKNGIVCFTDDISELSKNQREQLTEIKSLKSASVPLLSNKEKQDPSDKQTDEKIILDDDTLNDKLRKTSKTLQNELAGLEDVLNSLQRQRADLIKALIKKKTREEKKNSRKKVMKLNKQIKKYENRRKKFIRKAQLFNQKFQQQSNATKLQFE